jgi:hypothetical protein
MFRQGDLLPLGNQGVEHDGGVGAFAGTGGRSLLRSNFSDGSD